MRRLRARGCAQATSRSSSRSRASAEGATTIDAPIPRRMSAGQVAPPGQPRRAPGYRLRRLSAERRADGNRTRRVDRRTGPWNHPPAKPAPAAAGPSGSRVNPGPRGRGRSPGGGAHGPRRARRCPVERRPADARRGRALPHRRPGPRRRSSWRGLRGCPRTSRVAREADALGGELIAGPLPGDDEGEQEGGRRVSKPFVRPVAVARDGVHERPEPRRGRVAGPRNAVSAREGQHVGCDDQPSRGARPSA